ACRGSAIETPSIWTSPELGGNRPTTIRATVVLPEPDSPTSAKVSPFLMSKVTLSTALRYSRCPPSRTRLSQGFETSKTRRRFVAWTKGALMLRSPPAHRHRDGRRPTARPAEVAPADRHDSGRMRTRSAD